MSVIRFDIGDRLILKKKHPCSSDTFTVTKGGSDVKLVCVGCGRALGVPREKAEKMIKKVILKTDIEKM